MALVGTVSGSNNTQSTAVSGTLVISRARAGIFPAIPPDTILFVSGNISGSEKTVIGGDLLVSGSNNMGFVTERLLTSNGGITTINFDLSQQGIFYVKGPTGDFTANFTSVPADNNRIITPTVIVSQSATGYRVSGVSVGGSSLTLNWANGVTPTATANKHDVFGFSLIRSGSTWTALGQLSTYG